MIKIIFITDDMNYAKKLSTLLSLKSGEFQIEIVSDNCDFQLEAREHDFMSDLLFFSSNLSVEAMIHWKNEMGPERLVFLTENPVPSLIEQHRNKEKAYWSIERYGGIANLLQNIYFIVSCLENQDKPFIHYRNTLLVGVFSLSEFYLKSMVTVGIGRELKRFYQKRVLILSLNDAPILDLIHQKEGRTPHIGDYLYYLFEKEEENIYSRIDSFVVSDSYGVDFFRFNSGRNDLRSLKKEELIKVIKTIESLGKYDVIILEFGSDLSPENISIVPSCQTMIFVEQKDKASKKINQYTMDYLKSMGFEKNKNNWITFSNFLGILDGESVNTSFGMNYEFDESMKQIVSKVMMEQAYENLTEQNGILLNPK